MSWGARRVVLAVAMVATVSVNVPAASADAAPATNATLEAVLVPQYAVECDIYELHYTGHAEANNLTIGGNQQEPTYSDEAYCPTPDETTVFADTGTTITTTAPCTIVLSA